MNKKKLVSLLAFVCSLTLALCWIFRGRECEAAIQRRPAKDDGLPEGRTVRIEGEKSSFGIIGGLWILISPSMLRLVFGEAVLLLAPAAAARPTR